MEDMSETRRERPGFELWLDRARTVRVRFTADGAEHVPVFCPKCGAAGEEHRYDCFPRVG
jgi:RNase P subunit RPR2